MKSPLHSTERRSPGILKKEHPSAPGDHLGYASMAAFDMIDLSFTCDNVSEVLQWVLASKSAPHKNQAIAEGCGRSWNKCCDIDAPDEIECVMPVLADVETQWDLQIACDERNFELPRHLFENWLAQIDA